MDRLLPPAGLPGKSWMELILTFREGQIRGEGRDRVGEFLIKGSYQVEDGKCSWHKFYIGKHSISYQGYNEGKGIWGIWEFDAAWKGGFHIWPEAMGDPSQERLSEEIEEPISFDFVGEEVEEEVRRERGAMKIPGHGRRGVHRQPPGRASPGRRPFGARPGRPEHGQFPERGPPGRPNRVRAARGQRDRARDRRALRDRMRSRSSTWPAPWA